MAGLFLFRRVLSLQMISTKLESEKHGCKSEKFRNDGFATEHIGNTAEDKSRHYEHTKSTV